MPQTEKALLMNNLRNFIEEQKTWLRNTLDLVGWDIEDLEKITESPDLEFATCSVIPEHRLPPESIEKHEERCEKRNGQYPVMTDLLDIKLNEDEKKNILLIDDCDTSSKNATNDQISNSDQKKQQKESSSICIMELLAAERDAKRRRAAHRGKRVHSNKKTYNEILREVISSQMETLIDSVEDLDNKSELVKNEVTKKEIIEPSPGCYLGVGSKCYVGNPYKRWLSIEKEESELIDEMKTPKNEKHSNKSSRRESSYESSRSFKKSTRDFVDKKDYHKYREHHKEKDIRDESHDHRSHKNRDRSHNSSRYDDEKKYFDKNNSKRKYHESRSSSYESTKREKKHETSHKKSYHKSRHRDSHIKDDRYHK